MDNVGMNVAVISTAYNVEPWIGACIESVIAQTVPVFEHVVVDDGSTDATRREAERYWEAGVRVLHVTNRGMPNAINAGLIALSPEVDAVALLDGDDWYESNYIEACLDHMHEGDAVLPAISFREEGTTFARDQYGLPSNVPLLREPLHPTFAQMWECCTSHSAAMFHRRVLTEMGGFHGLLNNDCDWDLWLDFLARGYRFAYAPETHINYRLRRGSASRSGEKKAAEREANRAEILRHHAESFSVRCTG
jgi:glycosyltransferase involved in cell wall biosynthesis